MRKFISFICLLCALPSLAAARNVYDTHFAGQNNSACFIRTYSAAHLAKHPQQVVTSISVDISPLSPGGKRPILNVFATFRGESYHYHAVAYCSYAGDALMCQIEGDGGSFTLVGQKAHKVLLSVGPDGLGFEGDTQFHTLSGTSGDDRSFLIPNVNADLCN